MAPESDPTYRPPKSMQVTQEMGPLSSAAKLAALSATIAHPGLPTNVNTRNNDVASRNPLKALLRRARRRSRVREETQVDSAPEKRLPAPAANKGILASSALRFTAIPRPS